MLHFDFYLINKKALEKAEQLEKELIELSKHKKGLNLEYILNNHNFLLEIQPLLNKENKYSFYHLATFYPELNDNNGQTELLFDEEILPLDKWYEALEQNKDKYIILKRLSENVTVKNGEKHFYISDSDNTTYDLETFLTKQIHLDDEKTKVIFSTTKQTIDDSFLETASDRMNHLLNEVSKNNKRWKTVVISSKESLNIKKDVVDILNCKDDIAEEFILQRLLEFYHIKVADFSDINGEMPVFYCKLTPKQIAIDTNSKKAIVDDNGDYIWRWTDDEYVHSKDLLSLILSSNDDDEFEFEILENKKFKHFKLKKFKKNIKKSCELSTSPEVLTSIPFDVLIDNQKESLKDFDTRQSIELNVNGLGHILVLEYDENIDPLNNHLEI